MHYQGKRLRSTVNIPAWAALLWFPLTLLWQELVVKVYCFGRLLDRGTGYTLLFTFALGCLFSLICVLVPQRRRHLAAMILCGVTTAWFMAQTVYYTIFKTFLALYSVSGAGQVMQFWRDILAGIRKAALPLVLLALPVLILAIPGRKVVPVFSQRRRTAILTAVLAVAFQVTAMAAVGLSTGGVLSPRYLYYGTFVPSLSVSNFGVMTTLELDAKQLFFPQSATAVRPDPSESDPPRFP